MAQTTITMDGELLDLVRDVAKQECRTISGQIEYWVSRHADEMRALMQAQPEAASVDAAEAA